MKQAETNQLSRYLLIIKTLSSNGTARCKQVILTQIIPGSKKYAALSLKTYKNKLAPHINKGSAKVGDEILKIHHKQNWFKRCGSTMIENSAGLIMAMLSTKVVQNFVEVKEFSNLWGLMASAR